MQRELGARHGRCRPTSSTPAASNLATLVNLNQPLPNAAGRTTRSARCRIRTSASSSGAAQNGKSEYKGVDLGLEKRFAQGYAFGVAYTLGDSKDNTSEQLTTQGSNAFPQNARDFSAVVRAERLRRPPPLHRELRRGTCRSATTSSRATGRVSGDLRRALGPAVHRQPERQQRRHQHDRPAERRRRSRRARRRSISGSTPAAFQAVPSGTFGNELRNQLPGPGFQNFDLTLQRLIRFGGALRGDAALGHLQRVQHDELRPAEPQHLATRRRSGRSSSLSGDPRIMQLAFRFAF